MFTVRKRKRQSAIVRLKGAVARAEREVAQAESEIALLEQRLAERKSRWIMQRRASWRRNWKNTGQCSKSDWRSGKQAERSSKRRLRRIDKEAAYGDTAFWAGYPV